ncbi:MAG: Trm112 family protein [Dissulfurimicrobium sp.]|uniref:Trm112 family protein n=1 Tax=Dissulfurimicrobium sp. TaxID=2022436 RepID=UPI00404A9FD2
METSINSRLLELLACPKCKGDIRLSDDKKGIICDRCMLIYEIRDGIPVMLVDEAKRIKGAEE